MPDFTLPFPPVPASRPRVGKWGTFYTEPYKSYKKLAADWFKKNFAGPALAGALTVSIEVIGAKPKTTILAFPRPDVDNYAKGVLDAMNKTVFKDDTQVEKLSISKRWARKGEAPGMLIQVSKS